LEVGIVFHVITMQPHTAMNKVTSKNFLGIHIVRHIWCRNV